MPPPPPKIARDGEPPSVDVTHSGGEPEVVLDGDKPRLANPTQAPLPPATARSASTQEVVTDAGPSS